jgi:hypothetical protein
MGPVSIGFGVGFIILGLVGYLLSYQPTALIPAAFGVVFVLLGLLARQDRLRMHVMHLAVLVGLVGFVIPLWRIVVALTAKPPSPLAVWMNALMAAGCLAFVVLCVKSFIDARRRRRQEAGS